MPESKEKENEQTRTMMMGGYLDQTVPLKDKVSEPPRSATPSIRKFKIRRSVDTQEHEYEIVNDKIDDEHLEASMKNKHTPSVELHRINSITNDDKSLDNGLDPISLELITSSLDMSSSVGEENSEFIEADIEEEMEIIHSKVLGEENTEQPNVEQTTTEAEIVTPVITPPKISREMRNLQKSTNDSKVLTDFLNTSFDSPRIRRKPKEITPTIITATINEIEHNDLVIDKEVPLKGSPDGNESDSTVILREETDRKRRKSFSRSRSKSVSSKGRPKSVSRLLCDDISTMSEKEDRHDVINNDELSDISFSSKLFENRASNPPPKPGWDSYCFKCHADSAVLSLACRKCKCSYHRHCARLLSPNTPIPKSIDDFVCIDCIEIEKAKQSPTNKYDHPKIDQHMLKEMLTTVLEKIRTYPDREYFENDIQFKSTKESNQPLIVTQISLKTIEERIMNNYYKVSEAFLKDIKQLEHNWTIIDRNKTKSLKMILKYVCTEINEMEACVHCYSSSFVVNNWFTAPCKRPHLLIWAKLKGYPFWPAKVMSISPARDQVDVRFFGAHDRAWVYTANCIVFCEKDPNKIGKGSGQHNSSNNNSSKNTSKSQKGIADAMKEKDEYIENVRERYGFKYAPFRENLDPENLHKQLENQLPGLKKDNVVEKDTEGIQKEKLTLKIVKTPDGTQTIEQRTPKINERDRHPLYRVLSKNEDNTEGDQRVKAIILKRNTLSDSEKGKTKRIRTDDSASETSESTISMQDGKPSIPRRKSIKEPPKHRKSVRNVEKRSSTPDRSSSTPPIRKKPKPAEPDVENELLEEVPEPKSYRQSRKKSLQKDNAVVASIPKIPPGTSEIHSLRESPTSPNYPRSKQRSISFHRSRSSDKELLKDGKAKRRLSATNMNSRTSRDEIPALTKRKDSRDSILRRSLSQGKEKVKDKIKSFRKSLENRQSTHEIFDANITIKAEPMSDEEIVERPQVTVSDIAELVNDTSGKRKTILISTSDNSNDSYPSSRARKTFPNSVRQPDSQQIRNSNAMVCIPQVFSPPHAVSSPSHHTPNQDRSSLSILYRSNHGQLQISNGIGNHESSNNSSHMAAGSSSRRNSVNPNVFNDISVRQLQTAAAHELPKLVPKPSGVFSSEGNTFQRESGSVSALFSENAHRMTDYFKSLLIDTIGAISSGVPIAENVLLKLEIEKFKQQIQQIKVESQLKIDKLKKEHSDEIKLLQKNFDEKLNNLNQSNDQEKIRLITDIRQQCEAEKQRAVEATKREMKRTTWCSNCNKEARFYCCWNTSYCGPSCQKSHWQNHQKYCTNRNSVNESSSVAANKQPVNVENPSPVTISTSIAPNIRLSTNTRTIAIAKQPGPILLNQPGISSPTTNNISIQPNSIQIPYENANVRPSQNQTAIITTNAAGQKVLHTYPPQQFSIYQQKVPATKAYPSPVVPAAEINTNNLNPNLIVRTIQRTNSPQVTLISTLPPNVITNDNLTPICLPSNNVTSISVTSSAPLPQNISDQTINNIISNVAKSQEKI